jgi:predicted O-methyltransferase YrrM
MLSRRSRAFIHGHILSPVRDEARFLAASLLLWLGRRDGRVVNRNERSARDCSRALGSALRTTALRRAPGEERRWAELIEERRAELASEHAETQAVFTERPGRGATRWTRILRAGPVAEACGVISIPPLWGVLLMRLARELRPTVAVELGTGFGISAAYLAAGLELNGAGRLATFDGAEKWAAIAEEGTSGLGLSRAGFRVGPLSETLETALSELDPVGLAFIDAEHTKESTLRYFTTLLPHLSRGAVLVFDDIDFDAPMWEAWTEIREHPAVAVAVSLGKMGIVSVEPRGGEGARER